MPVEGAAEWGLRDGAGKTEVETRTPCGSVGERE